MHLLPLDQPRFAALDFAVGCFVDREGLGVLVSVSARIGSRSHVGPAGSVCEAL
ncbi:hypothetical protein Acr_00g0100770 [Actinidia rufa]|uniref:Uncharacterized protein n=1 Tax=Actinidia rufa TaxID=165716 RepID=A0A7J0E0J7_9ERIC|nr:hypothetical protein Acr_00g0100770 [Actinidia rufa]